MATTRDARLAGFRRRYAGPLDAADALWWSDHPDEPAPSGRRPPWLPDTADARALYAREPDPHAVARALAAAATRGPLLDGISRAITPRAPVPRPRPSRRGVALIGGVLAAAVGAGTAAGLLLPRAAPPGTALEALTVRAPAAATGSGSIRALGTVGSPVVRLYSTRDQGERCLTAVQDDDTSSSACASPAEVAADGVELDLVVPGARAGNAARDLVLRWHGRGAPIAAVSP